jgi:Mg2+ and Co2+ transporter CorA
MRLEGVRLAADLLGLDKEDLHKLGFTMVERSWVIQWANAVKSAELRMDPRATDAYIESAKLPQAAILPIDSAFASIRAGDQRCTSPGVSDAMSGAMEGAMLGTPLESEEVHEDIVQKRLDEVEQKADFWYEIIKSSAQQATRLLGRPLPNCDQDVRENVLEIIYDLTPERVKEVYDGIDRDADGCISLSELRRGLQKYNLPDISEEALTRVLELVTGSRGQSGHSMRITEFEAVLSRLKLAQLLHGLEAASPYCWNRATPGAVTEHLSVVDYSKETAPKECVATDDAHLDNFFFGHRSQDSAAERVVRWVHLFGHARGLDLTMLLALTVKYALHPLSVEDVIDQAPTKIDRNGGYYFVAIEQICLVSGGGAKPVQVQGCHVSAFCGGPPHFDTLITVAQPDRSFAADWPGAAQEEEMRARQQEEINYSWVEKLRQRLRAPYSRLRERRADFLMYQVIDLSADELVAVTRAYMKRLVHLEGELRSSGASLDHGWKFEVSRARLHLAVVRRRAVSLQRVVRRIIDAGHFVAELLGYFQDVLDHLNEAIEDISTMSERCIALEDMYERVVDRVHEHSQQVLTARLNKTLFVLTVFTTIFTPMQFLTGVYGMNFEGKDGKPSIPQLIENHGYYHFWLLVISYLALSGLFAIWLFYRLHSTRRRGDYSSIDAGVHETERSSNGALTVRSYGTATERSPFCSSV